VVSPNDFRVSKIGKSELEQKGFAAVTLDLHEDDGEEAGAKWRRGVR
jgi:hypothetical protein